MSKLKKMVKINEILNEISMGPFGSDIKVENFVSEGIPVLNGSNLTSVKLVEDNFKYVTEEKAKTFKKAIAKRKDIVITHRGTLGQISFIPENSKFENYVISQSQFRVSLNKELVDYKYFTYFFHTSEGQKRLLANKCHVGVPALAQATTNFRQVEIPLPILPTQQKIASVLSSLDAKIELNNRINAELEAMAKTLYDYWFVQFDFPNAEGKPYKSSGGAMVWSEELKREIPEGWEVSCIGEILQTTLGGTPSTSNKDFWTNGTHSWLSSGEIANFPIIEANLKITDEAIYNSATKLMPKGSVLISITRYIRPTILAIDACANQSVVGILESMTFKHSYLYPFLINEIPRYMMVRTGANQPHINKDTIDSTLIVRPEDRVLDSYYNLTENMYNQVFNNAFENQQLAHLRDWLLPMLMNGQVVVE